MGKRYIKLYEQIVNWEWYRNTNTFRIFVHLLLKANYADTQFEGREIKRGQIVTSISSLVRETGLSTKEVRVALDHLVRTGEMASQSFNKYRIITISKYNDYQSEGNQKGKQTASETAMRYEPNAASKGQATSKHTVGVNEIDISKTASKRQASGQANWQQYKNSIEPIEDHKKTPSESTPPDGFDQFWSAYPRHVGKAEAKKAFDKLKPDVELLGNMLDAIERQKASSQWQRDDGQYIPYPATWINKKRWEDEVEQTTVPVRRQTGGTVPAQKYEQRSYESEQEAAMDRMMNDSWGG